MSRVVLYPGTFDPPTNGHLDIIKRVLKVFPRILVAVARLSGETMFNTKERVKMLEEALAGVKGVEVESFSGLLTAYAEKKKALFVVRGLRVISDFEYEFQMALMNRRLKSDFEVVFMPPSEEFSFLSSSLVKDVASHGGNVRDFVPPGVYTRLKEKIR